MKNLEYQKWYDNKKLNESNKTFNKLLNAYNLLNEQQISDGANKALGMAKTACENLGVDLGTTEGKEVLKIYEQITNRIVQKNGEFTLSDAKLAFKTFLLYSLSENKKFAKEFTLSKIKSGATAKTTVDTLNYFKQEELRPLKIFAKQAVVDVASKLKNIFQENKQNEAKILNEAATGAAAVVVAVVESLIAAGAKYAIPLIIAWKFWEVSDEATNQVILPTIGTAGQMVKKASPGLVAASEKGAEAISGAAGTAKNITTGAEAVSSALPSLAKRYVEKPADAGKIKATAEKSGEKCTDFIRRIYDEGYANQVKEYDPDANYDLGDIFDCRDGSCLDNDGNAVPRKIYRVVAAGNSRTGRIVPVRCR